MPMTPTPRNDGPVILLRAAILRAEKAEAEARDLRERLTGAEQGAALLRGELEVARRERDRALTLACSSPVEVAANLVGRR